MITPDAILDRIQNHLAEALSQGIITLDRGGHDGREDSSKNERLITQTLALQFRSDSFFRRNHLTIESGPARFWYDFQVFSNDGAVRLPVNVKISSCGSADNLSSKEGLFYAMTGIDPKAVPHPDKPKRKWGINSWEPYCEAMAHYLGANKSADYYFLVVHKDNLGDVFWTSLRQMQKLEPNGNNLPYQADWNKNRIRVKRSWNASATFLMGVFREALVLRARVIDQFDASIGRLIDLPK